MTSSWPNNQLLSQDALPGDLARTDLVVALPARPLRAPSPRFALQSALGDSLLLSPPCGRSPLLHCSAAPAPASSSARASPRGRVSNCCGLGRRLTARGSQRSGRLPTSSLPST